MWDYLVGGISVAAGIYFYALSRGRIRQTEASQEYWTQLRAQHPFLIRFLPPLLVCFGVLRVVFKLLG